MLDIMENSQTEGSDGENNPLHNQWQFNDSERHCCRGDKPAKMLEWHNMRGGNTCHSSFTQICNGNPAAIRSQVMIMECGQLDIFWFVLNDQTRYESALLLFFPPSAVCSDWDRLSWTELTIFCSEFAQQHLWVTTESVTTHVCFFLRTDSLIFNFKAKCRKFKGFHYLHDKNNFWVL